MNGSMLTVNGRSLLNDSMRQQFQSLQRTGIGGDRYLDVTFADSAAGKMFYSWLVGILRGIDGRGSIFCL